MTDVFISYKREERARCAAIHDALCALKLTVWFDAHIEPGTSFDKEIERAVKAAKAILVLWSERAADSDWIRAEAREGKRSERLVAARLDDCMVPLEFSSVQAGDLFDPVEFEGSENWQTIVARIGRLVGRPGLGPFVQCVRANEAPRWAAWIASHGDDPLVPVAAQRLAALTPEPASVAKPKPKPKPNPKPKPKATPKPKSVPKPVPKAIAVTLASEPTLPNDSPANAAPVTAMDAEFGNAGNFIRTIATDWLTRPKWVGGAMLVALVAGWIAWGNTPADRREAINSAGMRLTGVTAGPGHGVARLSEMALKFYAQGATKLIEPELARQKKLGDDAVVAAAAAAAAAAAEEAAAGADLVGGRPAALPRGTGVCNAGPYIMFFDWDSYRLTAEAKSVLNNAVDAYANCGDAIVNVAAHTDRSGTAAYAVGLSQRMAATVSNYLASKGVPPGLIETVALGESQPRVPTADGVRELQNRRVEVTFGR
jgi:outer membrane protein OmpA-like peptidoglycan-associated protein